MQVNGTIDTTVGRRFYSFDAEEGDSFHIDAAGQGAMDMVLTIYDAKGIKRGRNDQEYPDGRGPQSCLLHRIRATGKYYLT